MPDPGFARFRADGEAHAFSPRIAGELQLLAGRPADGAAAQPADLDATLARYRTALARPPAARAVPRDELVVRRARVPVPLDAVEPATAIVRRFVVSAMSVGALSPEAHRALTIGIQRAGGAANTGEGGEDPAWYRPGPDGRAEDARIKQVASARFGVTAAYLARAEQLEIKIAQGSKPGEGGQLPGRKATAYIAALRRGQPGQAYISPPPHHDIYSIEDLAQLIADLRAINPGARIGVKLVASRGVGTIAAGVAKAGAAYIHLSGHAGGTGASPLVLDQARRRAVGARSRRGPPGPPPQRPARPGRAAHRWRPADRARPAGRRAPRCRGVRVRDRGARRDRLRHGPPVPPRHLSDRDRHAARRPAGQVRRDARRRRPLLQRDRRGPPARAGRRRGAVASARSSARAGASCARSKRHGRSWRPSSARRAGPRRPPAGRTRPRRRPPSAMRPRPRSRRPLPRPSAARARSRPVASGSAPPTARSGRR